MRRYRFLLVAALATVAIPNGLAAQAIVQPLGPTDADRLAAQMRLLAANPRDTEALATAGELSLRLGDLSGAAALFARADKVDPRNGRVKAGMASILVRSERPGEALRFFSQAEAYGWPAARYAADRGLAFDLVGQQGRAERDYRLALAGGADDETTRRYALSLGIAGQQAAALAQLDPLIRRQDRAAWRARAFVMAMNGDNAGATHIATTMMPPGMAQGLAAFFQRLPTLGPADRAFAVHFGEVAATPERVADARLAPNYPPLAPEIVGQPTQVAAVGVATAAPRGRRDREARPATARPVALAAAVQPRSAAPVVQPSAAAPPSAMREADVRVAATPAAVARPTSAPSQVAAASVAARPAPAPAQAAAVSPVVVTPTPTGVRTASTAVAASSALPTATSPIVAGPTAGPSPAAIVTRPTAIASTTPAVAPAPVAAPTSAPPTSAPSASVAQATPVAPVPTEAATERADSILARIVANLSIPASELGVDPAQPEPGPVAIPAAVRRAPASGAGRRVAAQAAAQEGKDAAVRRTVAARLSGDARADDPAPVSARGRGATELAATTVPARRGRRAAVAADDPAGARRGAQGEEVAAIDPAPTGRARGRRAAAAAEPDVPLTPAQRRAADRKAAADKKAAAEKKELADQAAAEKKAARANPTRIWVQVAGGANEGDLGKAWRAAQAKSPTLKGRAGYTTPLRATNRVLTGPFKTDAEARAFVNQLGKQGVSAFSFTSDAGQKVEKLGAEKPAK